MNNIIERIALTEKSSSKLENNQFTFFVNVNANKIQIKQAIEAKFGVKVVDVNTVKLPGKKRRRGRIVGHTKERKKAIVTINPESNIESIKALF